MSLWYPAVGQTEQKFHKWASQATYTSVFISGCMRLRKGSQNFNKLGDTNLNVTNINIFVCCIWYSPSQDFHPQESRVVFYEYEETQLKWYPLTQLDFLHNFARMFFSLMWDL